jgi:hypothetical protein
MVEKQGRKKNSLFNLDVVRGLGILWYILIPKFNKKIMLLLSMSNIMKA